jgi:glutamyl-tRNA(Gln) amidotransferase subunit D
MRYSEKLSKMLEAAGAEEGCRISLTTDGKEYKGVLMPHKDSSDPDVIVIKLKNGYHTGLRVGKGAKISVLEKPAAAAAERRERIPKKGLPDITIIGTGGTIGSQADKKTGAMTTGAVTERLVDMIPDALDIANIRTRDVASVFSENMSVENWQEIAKAVEEEMNNGAAGVIISHGTDTMGYTSAALSFMLTDLSGPVVLVGSQRSTDRPSSDAPGNMMASVRFCLSGRSGVYVVMQDTMSDDSFAVHRGTRARKMHTSRRDAFRSINAVPVARIDAAGKITMNDETPEPSKRTKAKLKMCRDVVLLQFCPGMDPKLFRDVIMRSKGVVIAGSGLGHVSEGMETLLKEAADNGTVVVMTSQCINGPTGLNVYDTGRRLQNIGVISVMDMLPETAYVKLMWSLANTDDPKGTMRKILSYEMSDRRTADVIW